VPHSISAIVHNNQAGVCGLCYKNTAMPELHVVGHSPICHVLGRPPDSISRAHIYAGGRCVKVDHGVYLGGRGFVFTTTISTSAITGGGVLRQ